MAQEHHGNDAVHVPRWSSMQLLVEIKFNFIKFHCLSVNIFLIFHWYAKIINFTFSNSIIWIMQISFFSRVFEKFFSWFSDRGIRCGFCSSFLRWAFNRWNDKNKKLKTKEDFALLIHCDHHTLKTICKLDLINGDDHSTTSTSVLVFLMQRRWSCDLLHFVSVAFEKKEAYHTIKKDDRICIVSFQLLILEKERKLFVKKYSAATEIWPRISS